MKPNESVDIALVSSLTLLIDHLQKLFTVVISAPPIIVREDNCHWHLMGKAFSLRFGIIQSIKELKDLLDILKITCDSFKWKSRTDPVLFGIEALKLKLFMDILRSYLDFFICICDNLNLFFFNLNISEKDIHTNLSCYFHENETYICYLTMRIHFCIDALVCQLNGTLKTF